MKSEAYEKSHEKNVKNSQQSENKNESSVHSKKSVYEEEETLEEQGYGILIRDMKKYIKGGSHSNSKNGSGSMRKSSEESSYQYESHHFGK